MTNPKEWEEKLKDITHNMGSSPSEIIRGSCGDPCHQCERDEKMITLISEVEQAAIQNERQRIIAILEGIKIKWKFNNGFCDKCYYYKKQYDDAHYCKERNDSLIAALTLINSKDNEYYGNGGPMLTPNE